MVIFGGWLEGCVFCIFRCTAAGWKGRRWGGCLFLPFYGLDQWLFKCTADVKHCIKIQDKNQPNKSKHILKGHVGSSSGRSLLFLLDLLISHRRGFDLDFEVQLSLKWLFLFTSLLKEMKLSNEKNRRVTHLPFKLSKNRKSELSEVFISSVSNRRRSSSGKELKALLIKASESAGSSVWVMFYCTATVNICLWLLLSMVLI